MRKRISVVMALAWFISLASVAAATEKKAEPMKAPEASAPARAAAVRKAPKSHQLTGTVEAVDAAGGTLKVQGRKVSVSLKAGEKVALDKIAVGDKVRVRYSGETASSVNKIPPKKTGKKVARKAAPSAPAVPAAPPEKK